MKKSIFTLSFIVLAASVWAQAARLPVNEASTTTKPTNTNTGNNNTGTNTSSELKKYSDPQGRFSIGYPGNWQLNDNTEDAVIQIMSPLENDNDKFKQNVSLRIEEMKSGTTIEDYVKLNMDEVKGMIKNYREVSSMFFNRNGSRAYQIVYKGTFGEMAYDVQIKQLFTIANGKGYILTYANKEDERDAFETTANKIFNSFKY